MLTIRKSRPDDIFAVIKIAHASLPERYTPDLFTQFYETFPEGFFVAEQHHKIVGFILGIKLSTTKAKILMLAVVEQHRRQQIGSALIDQFLREMMAQHMKHIELEVRTHNENAIHFYKKHNFDIIGLIPKFYQNEEDAYVMRRMF